MSGPIIVALISALVSLAVSLLTTFLQKRGDLIKVQREQEHGYAKALFERRVQCYPELFNLLSGYAKVIMSDRQTLENLAEFKQAVDDWDSKHAMFFTRATAKFTFKFRILLANIIDGNVATGFSKEDWENIRGLIGFFEGFLKADIGIYAAKPVGNVEEFYSAYNILDKLIEELKQKAQKKSELASVEQGERLRDLQSHQST